MVEAKGPPLPLLALRHRPLILTEQPSFENPDSQLVTAGQILSPRFERWCQFFNTGVVLNRKIWEYMYILNAMDAYIGLRPGTRALGFGVGREQIVPLLACLGCEVVATDYSAKHEKWSTSAEAVDDLLNAELCEEDVFRSHVSFRDVDMNDIPVDLRNFDCLWSCGSLEHIGGLKNGLDFIESAMACLRPGGIAVHTTEFNIVSDRLTCAEPDMSFYRRCDIVELAERLLGGGHQIVLNFTNGDTVADLHIDREPEKCLPLSLKWEACGLVITSIGLLIQKRLDPSSPAKPTASDHADQVVIPAGDLQIPPDFGEMRGPDDIIAFRADRFPDSAGRVVFCGPAIALPSGTYQIDASGELSGVFQIRVTAYGGQTLLHEQLVSPAHDPLRFTLTTPVRDFELVLSSTRESKVLIIKKIVLTRIS